MSLTDYVNGIVNQPVAKFKTSSAQSTALLLFELTVFDICGSILVNRSSLHPCLSTRILLLRTVR
jgi:hypothetical protein